MASGCIAPTSALGSQVGKAQKSLAVSPALTFLTDFHCGTLGNSFAPHYR